ncbi:DNA-binding protein [Clostridium sp. FP2]|uniref:DNA-binding protein n=1 Tax=Clostridium sp. FP2 TaxID=2724481 RepID=UPI0013E9909E|nr:DNA-binding protein [Clostridium sp. FP2]MBZ9625597.1 DNA-binding protein [Clostridium sp. FP2]
MDFITTKKASDMWGISARRVAVLCEQGRIDGVKKAGKTWILPSYSNKPVDGRLKESKGNKSQKRSGYEFRL